MSESGNRVGFAEPSEEVALAVRRAVAQALELDLDDVQMESSLFGLGAESLDLLDMAFVLEQEFRIQFPRADVLERAASHFGEDALVVRGEVTPLGLELLAKGMPELDAAVLRPGLMDIDVAKMITVGSFARITERLRQVKTEVDLVCTKCGGTLVESEVMPEFECAQCTAVVPLPDGDDVLLKDLIAMYEDVQGER